MIDKVVARLVIHMEHNLGLGCGENSTKSSSISQVLSSCITATDSFTFSAYELLLQTYVGSLRERSGFGDLWSEDHFTQS